MQVYCNNPDCAPALLPKGMRQKKGESDSLFLVTHSRKTHNHLILLSMYRTHVCVYLIPLRD
jgi:hypothetical protein